MLSVDGYYGWASVHVYTRVPALMCAYESHNVKHLRKSNRVRGIAWYAYAPRWYDYSTGRCLCFRPVINNLFEDSVNRCQDNKKQHRPIRAQHPPPTPSPFFSLINMEMSRSLLLVGKKAVMSLVTGSMDVFGLRGLLFSESMSYLCLGSKSKM